MAQYNVRAVDIETGEETVQGPFWSGLAATTHAQQWAGGFYGDDKVTWVGWNGPSSFKVGRVLEGGARSEPLVTIVIEEQEFDEEVD